MTAPWRAVAASLLAPTTCFSGALTAAAEPALRAMSIVLLNLAGAPDDVLTQAEIAAGRIFDQAGIHQSWRRASGLGRPIEPTAAQDLTPSFSSRLSCTDESNGWPCGGRRTWARCWGHVIAHEIDHLLLPTGAHSRVGIMKAVLDPALAAQGVLWFSPRQLSARQEGAAVLDRSSFTQVRARLVDGSDQEVQK